MLKLMGKKIFIILLSKNFVYLNLCETNVQDTLNESPAVISRSPDTAYLEITADLQYVQFRVPCRIQQMAFQNQGCGNTIPQTYPTWSQFI